MCTIIEEEWRDISGYEGLYQVSNLGRVKTLANNKSRKEKILKPQKDKYGYFFATLHRDGKRKMLKLHRLVANAFIPNQDNLPQVNHKDEIKTNNCVSNLEWCTNRYNINYGTRSKKVSKILTNRKDHSKRVFCVETGIIFPSINEAERITGIAHQNITSCCKGKKKHRTAGGYHWKYVD